MALTTIDELGDTIDTIHEKALYTRQFKAIMSNLCWPIRKGKGHTTINQPYFGEVTANALQEKYDMIESQTLEDTNVQITPTEVGCKVILTDTAIEDDLEELKSVAGKVLGEAYAKKEDIDLLGQLDDGTTSLGGASTTLTMGHIAAARANLQGNPTSSGGPAPDPYVMVHHPFTMLDIVDVITPVIPSTAAASAINSATPGAVADEFLRNYFTGRIFGINCYEDGNLTISSGDAKGGVFSSGKYGSIIHGIARDMQIEPQRDASARAWEINCVGRYGVGEYLAGWIVELYNDCSTPG